VTAAVAKGLCGSRNALLYIYNIYMCILCMCIYIYIYICMYMMYTGFLKHETTHTHHTPTRTLWGVWGDKHPLLDRVCSLRVWVWACVFYICFVFVFMCVVLAVVPVPIDNDNNNTLAYNIRVCSTTTTRRCVIRPERCIFQRALPTL